MIAIVNNADTYNPGDFDTAVIPTGLYSSTEYCNNLVAQMNLAVSTTSGTPPIFICTFNDLDQTFTIQCITPITSVPVNFYFIDTSPMIVNGRNFALWPSEPDRDWER